MNDNAKKRVEIPPTKKRGHSLCACRSGYCCGGQASYPTMSDEKTQELFARAGITPVRVKDMP